MRKGTIKNSAKTSFIEAEEELRREYAKAIHELDTARDEKLQKVTKEVYDKHAEAFVKIDTSFREALTKLKKLYPEDEAPLLARIREKLPNVYEMMYLGQHAELSKFNPWVSEVGDEQVSTYERFLKELTAEFNSVIKPMLSIIHKDLSNITFGRYTSRNAMSPILDPCHEPVEREYYVEFKTTSFEALRKLIQTLEHLNVFHSTEAARKRNRPFYNVFTLPEPRPEGEPAYIVLHLAWRYHWDPMYVLGYLLYRLHEDTYIYSEEQWNQFITKYEAKIQYVGGKFYDYVDDEICGTHLLKKLNKKYYENPSKHVVRKEPLDIKIEYTSHS